MLILVWLRLEGECYPKSRASGDFGCREISALLILNSDQDEEDATKGSNGADHADKTTY
jgi:hypothetical protein